MSDCGWGTWSVAVPNNTFHCGNGLWSFHRKKKKEIPESRHSLSTLVGTSERVQWGGGGSCQSLKWTPSKKTSLMFTWCWDREAGYKGVIRKWRDLVWILPLHLQILDLETPQLRKSNKLISLMLLLGVEGGNFTLHRIAQVGHFPASASVLFLL